MRTHLEALAAKVEAVARTDFDDELTAYLARFLVVRSCGYVEQVVVESCRGYVFGRSGGLVRAFAHSWLERTGNPTPEALARLVRRFDADLGDEFDQFLAADDQLLWREMHFLVDRRNAIAHGVSEGIGPRKALDLVQTASIVADWFILKFNPIR